MGRVETCGRNFVNKNRVQIKFQKQGKDYEVDFEFNVKELYIGNDSGLWV